METTTVSFDVRCTQGIMSFEARLDDQVIWQGQVGEQETSISHDIDDGEADHVLELVLSGKTADDTVIDQQGHIQNDRLLEIRNLAFDGVQLGQVFYDRARYHHDHNGTSDATEDSFFGDMGCNGSVRLEFSSPVYLWLLEHL